MMNGVTLLLILCSVIGGSFWSPELSESNQNPNIIIKEGHSVVVVEYIGEGKESNTKISIYPKDHYDGLEKVGKAKEAVSKNAEVVGEGSSKVMDGVHTLKEVAGEGSSKVMDGVHKVKEVAGEGSSKVMDGVHKVKEVAGEGSSKVVDGVHKVKEVAGEGSSKVMDGVHKVKEALGEESSKVKDGAYKVKEAVDEGSTKVKDGAQKVKEVVGERSGKVKDAVHKVIQSDMVDTPKRAVEDIKSNLSNLADIDRTDIEEFVCDMFGRCKQGLEKAEGATKEGVSKGAAKMKEVVSDTSSKVKDVTKKVKDSVAVDTPKRADTMIESTGLNSLMGVVQLLAFSMSFGMSMWMTFVSCYILGDALPREQFGMLQSRLYPIYYKIQAYCTGAALIAHLFSLGKKVVSSSAEIFYSINLVMSLLMSFVNFLYLEPKATQIMSERFKVEKEEGREGVTSHPRSGIANDAGDRVSATTEHQEEVKAETQTARLSEKLQMINRLSSYTNILTLISLSMHMVYLGFQIQDSGSESGSFGRASGAFEGPPPS